MLLEGKKRAGKDREEARKKESLLLSLPELFKHISCKTAALSKQNLGSGC